MFDGLLYIKIGAIGGSVVDIIKITRVSLVKRTVNTTMSFFSTFLRKHRGCPSKQILGVYWREIAGGGIFGFGFDDHVSSSCMTPRIDTLLRPYACKMPSVWCRKPTCCKDLRRKSDHERYRGLVDVAECVALSPGSCANSRMSFW